MHTPVLCTHLTTAHIFLFNEVRVSPLYNTDKLLRATGMAASFPVMMYWTHF